MSDFISEDIIEYYQNECFRLTQINKKLMERYDALNKKHSKLIIKYKKLINNHDELIKSFLRVKYAYKCYNDSLASKEDETLMEQCIRLDYSRKRLIRNVSAMLTCLNECGLLDEPCDNVVSNK